MKKKLQKIIVSALCIHIALFTEVSVFAEQPETESIENNDIIMIDNRGYTAQDFMQRVMDYTEQGEPINNILDDTGKQVEFTYNERGLRERKITEDGTVFYEYDINNNLLSEELPSGEIVEFLYDTEGDVYGLLYQNQKYLFIMDESGYIMGLGDAFGQEICIYQYDDYGYPIHVYEISDKEQFEHFDNEGDSFVGCVNPMRYRGDCFDVETGMYYLKDGGYYDSRNNKVIGADCHIDMQELFGDQYKVLDAAYNAQIMGYGNESRISSNDVYQLVYAASRYYEEGLRYYTEDYSSYGDEWYTNFSGGKEYYLVARIIYAENTNTSTDSTMNSYLKYNRQGIGWEILNRYLEDDYRYRNGHTLFFSNKDLATAPSFYSVLTKKSQFTSIEGGNAKGYISTANTAYQEAFWIASCMKVCNNFEQWNAVVPRPAGITSQCYNRGGLSSSSAPNSGWVNVIFPGFTTNYAGKKSYSEFTYYSNISKFNILFSYSTESLYIDSEYYK